MKCKINFIKSTNADIIIGNAETCRIFDIGVNDIKEVALFLRMLIDNRRNFETSFELPGSMPKIFVYFDEIDSDDMIRDFNKITDFLKKEVFDFTDISFLEINAGVQQETFKKY